MTEQELQQATGQSFNNAFRLIRTESSFVDSSVRLEEFKQAKEELGYTHYIYDAFLDSRTSEICRDLDKEHIPIDEAEIGVNFPPMHPNCRSTCVLDVGEEIEKETLTDNPIIDDKTVKGSYNKEEIQQLQNISDAFKKAGYEPSGHAIQRVFERSSTDRTINVLKNGKKYLDRKGNLTYYNRGLSIHIDKNTKKIITVIYRDPERPLPKTWKKYE